MRRTLSAIVPARLSSPEAVRNLNHVLELVSGTQAREIVCVLQGESTYAAPVSSERVQTVVVDSRRDLFERSRLVNRVLPDLSADLVWVIDPNLHLPFNEIASRLADSEEVAIQPYSKRLRLSERQSAEFLKTRILPSEVAAERAPFGKSSFVIERDVLLALGGMSEDFVGPAEEGLELSRRFRCFFRDVAEYEELAVALWAPKTALERAAQRENKALLARLAAAIATGAERYLRERLSSSLTVDVGRVHALSRKRERASAFRISCPTPPPCRPTQLPGSLWGITVFFNPAAYRSKRENYTLFRERLAEQGLSLCSVELAFGDAAFELEPKDAERLVQLRCRDVLWQKERLLNVAMSHLPSECDKVVWLDADVLFDDSNWIADTARALERWVVVQPFTRSVRLLPGELRVATEDLPLGSDEHEILHGMAWGVFAKGTSSLSRYLVHGHSGYAWAARRAVVARHGLYDANVLGNGDLNIAHAMFGGARHLKTERLSDKARRHLEAWADQFHADVQGSVGFVEGTLFHLWHGQKADRRYLDRLEMLISQDYDPERDLTLEPSGAYGWASDKPELHAFCRDYFFNRREDRGLRRNEADMLIAR